MAPAAARTNPEKSCLLPQCRERRAFELQGFQGDSDSAAFTNGSSGAGGSSILGGAYAPADRRRACAAVLSVMAALLLVAVLVIGGFGLFEVGLCVELQAEPQTKTTSGRPSGAAGGGPCFRRL